MEDRVYSRRNIRPRVLDPIFLEIGFDGIGVITVDFPCVDRSPVIFLFESQPPSAEG